MQAKKTKSSSKTGTQAAAATTKTAGNPNAAQRGAGSASQKNTKESF